jgi:hypothetical protein
MFAAAEWLLQAMRDSISDQSQLPSNLLVSGPPDALSTWLVGFIASFAFHC